MRWTSLCANLMFFKITSVFLFLSWIYAPLAEGQTQIDFTSTLSMVNVGEQYIITWAGGDSSDSYALTLLRGTPNNLQIVSVLTTTATSGEYDWTPDSRLVNGEDYELMVDQAGYFDQLGPFSLSGGLDPSSSSTSTFATTSSASDSLATSSDSTSTSPMTGSSEPATVTATVTISPTSTAMPVSSSSSTSLLDPTPSSSFDAEKYYDNHLSINDKVAMGLGIPIILIALSTLGYWRAAKFFFHRKITGQPKLPIYSQQDPAGQVSPGVFSAGSTFSSRTPSLWGASSRQNLVVPDNGFGPSDTELLTSPKMSYSPLAEPDRPTSALSNQSLSVHNSSMAQEWHAV